MANRVGNVNGQSSSVSGTTLRIRPVAGYYPGDTGNSVQLTNSNFIASNIRSGVNLFGVVGTMPLKPDDYRGSPGGQILTHGDITVGGYFGRYTGICTGNALSSAVGLASRGSGTHFINEQIMWVKFGFEDKILFIATKPLRKAITWNQMNSVGVVFGTKEVTFGGITYKCRNARVGYSGSGITGQKGASDLPLLKAVNAGAGGTWRWDNLTDEELFFENWGLDQGELSIGQEDEPGDSSHSYWYYNGRGAGTCSKTDPNAIFGWRPILEVV